VNTSPEPNLHGPSSPIDSLDCVNVIFDGPGDRTVRPLEGELLKHALAERERLARLQRQNGASEAKGTGGADLTPKNNPS
jgi:hypothetical protein